MFGVVVDNYATCHLGSNGESGGKCINVDDVSYKTYFDWWKCYFSISKPTVDNLMTLLVVELTTHLSYEPQRRHCSRRVPSKSGVSIAA